MTADYLTTGGLTPERRTLMQRKVAMQHAVSRRARLEVHEDQILGQLVYRLEDYVLAEKLVGDTKTVHCLSAWEVPTSTWQYFKQRHAESWWLGWLVRRRPVVLDHELQERDHEVTFERYATYPESILELPELGRPVIVEEFK